MSTTAEIRPYRVDLSQKELDDLRQRIGATRWPSKELVDDRSQGVQLATLRELAAWMLDHDTDSYLKIADAFVHKQSSGNLTRDNILDNITLYWLTGTGASAAGSYWESGQAQAKAAGQAPPPMTLPFGFTTFPGEIWRTPRSWIEKAYPNVVYFNEVGKGGHFAAWEEPQLFTEELRSAFRSLR